MDFKQFIRDYVLNINFLIFLLVFWGLSWVLMLMVGSPLINWLKRLRGMKWSPREDTPDSHLQKAGTPSMGGLGIIGAALVSFVATILFILVSQQVAQGRSGIGGLRVFSLILLFPVVVGLHCVLGLVDDWSKARGRGGLLARQKLAGQIGLAVFFVGAVVWALATSIAPVSKAYPLLATSPVVGSVLLALILVATSNAVNITDGIDGLASGLCIQVGLVFAFLYANLPTAPTREVDAFYSTAVFLWCCLGGSCLGFLAFNKYPAKVFMGDTGSLALGAALGAGAILSRAIFLLPFIGFIFWVEMFSVIAQVVYFKYTKRKYGEGKRIFRRAPLHHHFELGGWSEWRVVGTFWAINALTTVLGLILWKTGVLPRFP